MIWLIRFPAPMRMAGLLVAALLALGCGSSSKGPLLDPRQADAQTHAALISEADLPGTGWNVTQNDRFNDPRAFDLIPGAACNDLKALVSDSEKGRAGRAERAFEKPSPPFLSGTIVRIEVAAYENAAGLNGLMDRLKQQVSAGSYLDCQAEAFKVTLGSRKLVSVTFPSGAVKAPHDGVSISWDRQFEALNGPPITRHEESFVWVESNVVVTADVDAPKEAFSADLVKAVIQKTQSAIDRASKEK